MLSGQTSNGLCSLRRVVGKPFRHERQCQRWLTLDGRQRLSNIWTNSTNIDTNEPSIDEEGNSLLQRAGFIAPSASGYFHILPLGLRVQDRLIKHIDKHMLSIGAGKLALSSVCDHKLWQKSGRLKGKLQHGKHELISLLDRKKSGYILSPTHEEVISELVKPFILSYRNLPLRLYQITSKYRDELRPRQGLLRTKEFLMKDLYTFDSSLEQALETYNQVRVAYNNLFRELGIPFLTAEADSGSIGGKMNHEYHYVSPLGEDTVWTCNSCNYAANDEVVERPVPPQGNVGLSETDSCKCPRCSTGEITPTRTIEVGHTFHLGTRYSEPLRISFSSVDPGVSALTQMGCHGIGVSRLLGTIANVMAKPTGQQAPIVGLRWPPGFAPYDVLIIAAPDHQEWGVYDQLIDGASPSGVAIDAVIDDRAQDIHWKLKRADLTGYPVVVIFGKKYSREGQIEVFCRETRETAFVDAQDVKATVLNMLTAKSNSK